MLQPFPISSRWFLGLRFRHLAVVQLLELMLLSAPLPDPLDLFGRLFLFTVLVPLQFFNRLLGLRLAGEQQHLLVIYSRVFAVLSMLWAILSFWPQLSHRYPQITACFYGAVAVVTAVVMWRLVSNIWRARDVHNDVLFAAVIIYAALTVLGFELHSLNHLIDFSAYGLKPGLPHHSQLMLLSIGGTTTAGSQIPLNGITAQAIFYFQGLFSQLFLVVFVARMIGLHTGRR